MTKLNKFGEIEESEQDRGRYNLLDRIKESQERVVVRAFSPRSELHLEEAVLVNYDDNGLLFRGKRNWRGQKSEERNFYISRLALSHIELPDTFETGNKYTVQDLTIPQYNSERGTLMSSGGEVGLGDIQREYMELFLNEGIGNRVDMERFEEVHRKYHPLLRKPGVAIRKAIHDLKKKLQGTGLRIERAKLGGYVLQTGD